MPTRRTRTTITKRKPRIRSRAQYGNGLIRSTFTNANKQRLKKALGFLWDKIY